MSWPWSPGQRSLKIIESGTIRYSIYGFVLLSSPTVTLSVRRTVFFLDIRLQKCRDLETLKISAFDREPVTSYWFSILTISCRFEYIQCQKISRPWNPGQWSLKVIGTDTYRSATYDFLLTFHSNHGTISFHFRDNRQFQSETANFHQISTKFPNFALPTEGVPLGIGPRRSKSKN